MNVVTLVTKWCRYSSLPALPLTSLTSEQDDELQLLMLQEMNQMRQQRLNEQSSIPSVDLLESEEISKFERAKAEISNLSSQLAALQLERTSSQCAPPQHVNEDEAEEDVKQLLNGDDEAPAIKNHVATINKNVSAVTPQARQHQGEFDSPPVSVAKRRTGRAVVDSDDEIPPPSNQKSNTNKTRPTIITISDSDSDKENQPSAVNRPRLRISKRDSTAGSHQPSKTKQILQGAHQRFQSFGSDTDSGNSSAEKEGCGDWVYTDEERSEDEDGDMSGFVVPDDEVEDDNFEDGEYDESDEGAHSGHYSEDDGSDVAEIEEVEEVEEVEESDEEVDDYYKHPSSIPARTPPTASTPATTRTPAIPSRTPSKPKTPASRSTFYSVKSTPKYPVILPKTPQTSKKRNFDLQIARELYNEFNMKVFGNRLPEDLPISWSVNLRTTAGHCNIKVVSRT
jgi:hypothetical protein